MFGTGGAYYADPHKPGMGAVRWACCWLKGRAEPEAHEQEQPMPVTKNDQGTWDYHCPRTAGCGDDQSFRSTGWPRKSDATERGKEHEAQPHLPGENTGQHTPMRDLDQFRTDRGLNIVTDGDGNAGWHPDTPQDADFDNTPQDA